MYIYFLNYLLNYILSEVNGVSGVEGTRWLLLLVW